MIGIYFSGTGNTRFCVETFVQKYDPNAILSSIENKDIISLLENHQEIVFGYPVQYSELPKIVRDFVVENQQLWRGKKIFVIATMGLFSGDGAGVLARLLKSFGAIIIGGMHVRMPDSICDEKVLKNALEKNKQLVNAARDKINKSVEEMKKGKPSQEGFSIFHHFAGLFGQRLYFGRKTKQYSKRLKIDKIECVGCGKCASVCPLQNISIVDHVAIAHQQCTMCYRCVNLCPRQAITLLGNHVTQQGTIERYL